MLVGTVARREGGEVDAAEGIREQSNPALQNAFLGRRKNYIHDRE
jgi:hypothetical protein